VGSQIYPYVPVVFSQPEVQMLFDALEGTWRLIAQVLYGGGLRLNRARTAVISPGDRL
jgi:hypothetical protein